MNSEDVDKAYELVEQLWKEVHDLMDAKLEGVSDAVEELVRTKMTDEFRFWKRR